MKSKRLIVVSLDALSSIDFDMFSKFLLASDIWCPKTVTDDQHNNQNQ